MNKTRYIFSKIIKIKEMSLIRYPLYGAVGVGLSYFLFISIQTIYYYNQWITTKDQWRIYDGFFQAKNILDALSHSQNGHMPFFPGVAFWTDINYFNANNLFLLIFGLFFLFLAILLIGKILYKELNGNVKEIIPILSVILVFLFSLENGNHLLIANNTSKTYLLLYFYLLGIVSAFKLADYRNVWDTVRSALPNILLVIICGVVATFSFSPGISYWVALLIILIFFRSPKIVFYFIIILVFFACLSIYISHANSVSNQSVVVGRSVYNILRGFSSIVSAFPYVMIPLNAREWLNEPFSRMVFAFSITGLTMGLSGYLFYQTKCQNRVNKIAILGAALLLLGFGTACLIGIGRQGFFDSISYWPRYRIWSFLLWLGIYLMVINLFYISKKQISIFFLVLLFFSLIPQQHFRNRQYYAALRQQYSAIMTVIISRPHVQLVRKMLFKRFDVVERVNEY